MTEKMEVYRCNICGNIVYVLHPGVGELVCCGQPMELLKEKTEDEGMEKHVPVVEKTESGIKIKVGSIPHIEWVEVISDGKVYRKFLKPGEAPGVIFPTKEIESARAYCNVHGLWSAKINS